MKGLPGKNRPKRIFHFISLMPSVKSSEESAGCQTTGTTKGTYSHVDFGAIIC